MITQTARLTLRPLTEADLPALCRTLTDPLAMYAYAHAFSDAECVAWLTKMLTCYQTDGFGLWAVIRQSDGQFLGQCGLTRQNFNDTAVVEIGYLLERRFWHQGYAIEAARGVKAYAFDQLQVPRVW
nr:GNAT family N-acetyltransferase [Lacticaseibacillus daqingensis]